MKVRRERKTDPVPELAGTVGFVALTGGVFMISPAWAFIVGGALLLAAAIVGVRK